MYDSMHRAAMEQAPWYCEMRNAEKRAARSRHAWAKYHAEQAVIRARVAQEMGTYRGR